MILMKQTKQKRKSTKQAKKGWNVLLNQFGKNKDEKTLSNTFYLYHCSVPQKKIPFTKITFFKNECQTKSRITVVLFYFALSLVQKTRANLSTNQMQN